MEARHAERTAGRRELTPEVLRSAGLALRHKLRRRFSADFVSRHADDLLAQAAKEYVGALDAGTDVRNPGGFIVDIAYKRALDAFGRERRAPLFDEIDAELPLADPRSPQPVELIERKEERSHLYEAVARLEPEERRVLALVYFEGMSGREAAEPLGVSESTSLRRLHSAQRKLREWLPAIEAGQFCAEAAPQLRALSEGIATATERTQAALHLRNCARCREQFARREEFAFEVGLAAWLTIATGGAQQTGFADQLIAVADTAREWVGGLVDRARDFLARFLSSGGGEGIAGAASGPLGKTAAACGAAVVTCALTGVVGPGVGGVDLADGDKSAAAREIKSIRSAPPTPTPPTSAAGSASAPVASSGRSDRGPIRAERERRDAQEPLSADEDAATTSAESQFGVETLSNPSGPSAPEPEPVAPAGQSSDAAASQQFGVP